MENQIDTHIPDLPVYDSDPTAYPQTWGLYRRPLEHMKEEFRHSINTKAQIDDLNNKQIASWRQSRGDGNCYYRSVANAYLEYCIRTGTLNDFYNKILQRQGFFSYVSEQQPETTMHVLTHLYKLCMKLNKLEQMRDMQKLAQDAVFDQHLMIFFRCIASTGLNQLQTHDELMPYLLDDEFTRLYRLVNTMGEEAEGLIFRIVAIVLNVQIKHYVFYSNSTQVGVEEFCPFDQLPPECSIQILIRPGHYDMIYSYQENWTDNYDYEKSSFGDFKFAVPPAAPKIDPMQYLQQLSAWPYYQYIMQFIPTRCHLRLEDLENVDEGPDYFFLTQEHSKEKKTGTGIYYNQTIGIIVWGTLVNGQAMGNVTVFMKENFYVGEVELNFQRKGMGTQHNYFNPDTPIYQGEWDFDEPHGQGIKIDGGIVLDGAWNVGSFQGKGKKYMAQNPDHILEEGEFKTNNIYNGIHYDLPSSQRLNIPIYYQVMNFNRKTNFMFAKIDGPKPGEYKFKRVVELKDNHTCLWHDRQHWIAKGFQMAS